MAVAAKSNRALKSTINSDTFTAPFLIFLVSFVPYVLCYTLNTQKWMQDSRIILVVGVIVLSLVVAGPYLAIRRMEKPDFILYVMPLFMFSSMVDLIIALEADHIIAEFMTFYLKEGEPYLWTAYGTMINYWDGFVHYGLCLWMLFSVYRRQSYRKSGLYWVGSITNSLLVLVPGSILGKFGVKWAILLNIPYLFVPVWIGYKLLSNNLPFYIRKKIQKSESIYKRPLDILFVWYFLFAAGVDLFRGFIALGCQEAIAVEYLEDHEPYIMDPLAYPKVQIALGCQEAIAVEYLEDHEPYIMDPLAYPKVQMLVYMFYFVPYYACAIYGLFNPGQEWMSDWALIYAGAAAQGQFSHIGGSFHRRTDALFHVPTGSHSRNVFWLINISLFVFPQIFALSQNMRTVNKGKRE